MQAGVEEMEIPLLCLGSLGAAEFREICRVAKTFSFIPRGPSDLPLQK